MTLIVILIIISQDLNQRIFVVECQGTVYGLTIEHKALDLRYKDYRNWYENCTLIRDNLEITFIETIDPQYDFSFLNTIREVNGYVIIYGNYLDRIPLNGLRIIRGWKTYREKVNNVFHNLSLYVGWNRDRHNEANGLKELQLTSLVGTSFTHLCTQSDVFV